ncbi:hypothetical protein KY331_05830 [Candidatus Woesearchaeota archaeon]|nr:hypothetical protein [Candidatus Woesearchaeota archaeon]
MEDKEINITYETLHELLRREKNREEIQKLEVGFLNDVADYLKEKIELGLQQRNKKDLFAAEETRKAELQLANIKKILRELYEKREKKILHMAIDASRSTTSLIDTANLLKEEKRIFDELVDLLNKYRKGVLYHLMEGMNPSIKEEVPKSEPEPKPVEEPKEKKVTKLIRFVTAVPKFVGQDLEVYGPFEENDMANLPTKIADVLVGKSRAEEMND